MRALVPFAVVAAALAWSLPEAPGEGLDLFDGSRPAARGLSRAPDPAPGVEGAAVEELSEVSIPDDLASARSKWGHEAQAAALSRRDPSRPVRLAVIGDCEPGRFPWQRILPPPDGTFRRQLRAIHAQGADLIVQLGDFVSKGDARRYRAHLKLLEGEVRLPAFFVIGNHDRSRPNGAADKAFYLAVFGKSDFHYDVGGWRLVALDTSDRRVTPEQLDWLDRALDVQGPKIVFTHVPPAYLAGSFVSKGWSRERPHGEGAISDAKDGYFEEGSREFGDIVSRRRVARVYMGHIHAYGVADHGGVRHVLSGAGGRPSIPSRRAIRSAAWPTSSWPSSAPPASARRSTR